MAFLDTAKSQSGSDAGESLDALVALHTLSVDTQNGFRKMAEKAEPAFLPTVERFNALHGRHVARLDNMVREMGGLPDENGSFMGKVNVAVVTLRAVFDAIDGRVMDRVRSGETTMVAAFDRALAASLPQGHYQALTQMKAELTGLLDETQHIN